MHRIIAAFAIVLSFRLQILAQDRPSFDVVRTDVAPKIDGVLDDELWKQPPLILGDWISYNPLYGEKQALRTEVRVGYDERNLYFAFHCFDAEPDKIRTTISRRDNIFNDDWVGLSLDSAGTGQTSYHLIANPNGIQMDALNTSSSGENWDADFIWDSAGKVTDDGYVVEIKLPLQSIRFAGGDKVIDRSGDFRLGHETDLLQRCLRERWLRPRNGSHPPRRPRCLRPARTCHGQRCGTGAWRPTGPA